MEKRVERWRIFLLERMIKAVVLKERYRNVWRPEMEKAWAKQWVSMARKVWLKTPISLRRVVPENSYAPGDFSVLKWNTFFGFRQWLFGVVLESLESGSREYTFDFSLKQLEDQEIKSERILKKRIEELSKNWFGIIKVRFQPLGPKNFIVIFAVRHLDSVAPPKAF